MIGKIKPDQVRTQAYARRQYLQFIHDLQRALFGCTGQCDEYVINHILRRILDKAVEISDNRVSVDGGRGAATAVVKYTHNSYTWVLVAAQSLNQPGCLFIGADNGEVTGHLSCDTPFVDQSVEKQTFHDKQAC